MNALQRMYRAWRAKPLLMTLMLAFIPIGIAVLIEGVTVSHSFDTLHNPVIIRCVGAGMTLGGASTAYSVIHRDALYEVLGLSFAALATTVYGIGVALGLGIHGFITVADHIAMTIGFLGRIALLCRSAKIAAAASD